MGFYVVRASLNLSARVAKSSIYYYDYHSRILTVDLVVLNSETFLKLDGGKVLLTTMKNVPNLVNVQEVGAEIIGDLCQMGGNVFLK